MKKFILSLFLSLFFAGIACAMIGPSFYTSSGGTFVNYQAISPGFESYYGGGKSTYWPILAEGEKGCESGQQDIMLQVALGGCQPMVVRSDLLAEQNVPVFCQISAYQVNPLINIEKIRSISFSGSYPKEIIGAGFHPARAALRTRDTLIGSPVMDNVGYVVVILKKNEKEKELPKFVNVTLRAKIDYEAGNILGVGRTEFILEPMSEQEWKEGGRVEDSFWRGRYSARLDGMDAETATISLYYGDKKFSTFRLKKGETSSVIYAPGYYCRAGLKAQYLGSEIPKTKARLEINDGSGTSIAEVYEGSKIINDRCSVKSIKTDSSGTTGSVEIQCPRERFTLKIGGLVPSGLEVFVDSSGKLGTPVDYGTWYSFDFGQKGVYEMSTEPLDNILTKKDSEGAVSVKGGSGSIYDKASASEKIWIDKVEAGFIKYKQIKVSGEDAGVSGDKIFDGNGIDNNLSEALEAYETFVKDYSAEEAADEKYGETALTNAIKLAQDSGRQATLARLMKEFIRLYPDSEQSANYESELKRIDKIDISKASKASMIDNEARTIRLVSFSIPKEKANARFIIDGREDIKLEENEGKIIGSFSITGAGRTGARNVNGYFNVTNIYTNEVRIVTNCDVASVREGAKITQTLKVDVDSKSSVTLCGHAIKLDEIETAAVARVALIPEIRIGEETNLTVTIGIVKRAIQLSPEKTKDKIARLNETIKKWEGISENLGKVVSGMKGACFATSGILMFKNFMSGLSGETLARQQVMQGEKGWTNWCKNEMGKDSGKYNSIDDCFRKNAELIDRDVVKVSSEIKKLNEQIKAIDDPLSTGGFLESKSVDSSKTRKIYADRIKAEFPKDDIAQGVSAEMTSAELRDTWLNLRLKRNAGLSESASENVNSKLKMSESVIKRVAEYNKMTAESAKLAEQGLAPAVDVGVKGRTNILAPIVDGESARKTLGAEFVSEKSATVRVPSSVANTKTGSGNFAAGNYILGLKAEGNNMYSIQEIYDTNGRELNAEEIKLFLSSYSIGNVKAVDSKTYYHRITNPEVRYYETEPYKGMPAIVPFDVERGWYAATRQTLPTFGGIGAFDASGRVASFTLCNVDGDSRINFDEGLGDDICEEINMNTGQTYDMFPGLSREQAKELVTRAKSALEEAARNYGKGKSTVTIAGQAIKVGKPMTNVPGTNCQDFMSPKDCLLMFNVCDPVICPASRCNLGGKYQVADVIQSGVIGSVFLCLPNIKEGIVVPVCVSGIKAGIDGYLSVMKSYRDCLQENLNSGKMVGICDQIYSIYLCEFFWREISPIANILIPKLLETAYGQGARGGGEYLTVMNAWDNMKNSVDYFTQSYAVNSMKAFQARSIEEAGGEFCKAYISMASPKTIKSLLEPDSPPQFYATFSSTRYSDATVPTTAQYKVYYHIFAGKDTGVYYNVYLKGAPESSYAHISASMHIASGFITRGQYASETRDFTAPEGYKELCVRINEKEECGFKQVTSEFAINYLKDEFAKDELERRDITSGKACVSGTPGLNAGALSVTNIQQAGEEMLEPRIYNRGIVRVCATENPGKTTDPGRFVEVGYCDNPKMKCWLDQKSVGNAIGDANKGAINETLQYLENLTRENLMKSGELMTPEEANLKMGDMRALRAKVSAIGGMKANIDAIAKLMNDIEKLTKEVDGRIYLNHQKALVEITRAEVKDKLIRAVIDEFSSRILVKEEGMCGNNQLDEGEECDKEDNIPNFRGLTCSNYDYQAGDLTCTNDCKIDYSTCENMVSGGESTAVTGGGEGGSEQVAAKEAEEEEIIKISSSTPRYWEKGFLGKAVSGGNTYSLLYDKQEIGLELEPSVSIYNSNGDFVASTQANYNKFKIEVSSAQGSQKIDIPSGDNPTMLTISGIFDGTSAYLQDSGEFRITSTKGRTKVFVTKWDSNIYAHRIYYVDDEAEHDTGLILAYRMFLHPLEYIGEPDVYGSVKEYELKNFVLYVEGAYEDEIFEVSDVKFGVWALDRAVLSQKQSEQFGAYDYIMVPLRLDQADKGEIGKNMNLGFNLESIKRGVSSGAGVSGVSGESGEAGATGVTGQTEKSSGLVLESKYNPAESINILKNGEKTSVYLKGGKVMHENNLFGFDYFAADDQIGVIASDGEIKLTSGAKDKIGEDLWNELNGKKVSAGESEIV